MVTLNPRTRQNEILQFVEDNPRCTKTQVITAIFHKGFSSPVTTHKILDDLEKDNKIIVKPDESNHQTHRLTINDMNEYYLLRNRINDVKERVNKLSKVMSYRLKVKKRFKNIVVFDSLKQDYLNLLHYAQLTTYREITSIAKRIDTNIESRDDQERLYFKLTEVLNVSDILNRMLAPEVQSELEKLLDKMKNAQNPDLNVMMANMTKEIAGLFASKA